MESVAARACPYWHIGVQILSCPASANQRPSLGESDQWEAGKEWRDIHQSIRQPLHSTVCQMNGVSYQNIIFLSSALSCVMGTSASTLETFQITKIWVLKSFTECVFVHWLKTDNLNHRVPISNIGVTKAKVKISKASVTFYSELGKLLSCGPIIIQWLNHLVRVYGKFSAASPVISRLLCLYRNNLTPRQTFSHQSSNCSQKTLED